MAFNNEAQEYNQRGMVAYDSKDYEMAKSMFSLSLEKDPDFVDAQRNLGEILLEMGEYENGVQVFVDILSKHGNDVLTLTRMAQLYAEIGKNEDAVTLLEKVMEIEPDNDDAKTMLSDLRPDIANSMVEFNIDDLISRDVEPVKLPPEPVSIQPEPVSIQFNYKSETQNDLNIDLADEISSGFRKTESSTEIQAPSLVPDKGENETFIGGGQTPKTEPSIDLQASLHVPDKSENETFIGGGQTTKVGSSLSSSTSGLQLSKFSTDKFFERKFRNRDLVLLKGAVEEDGDSYVIDLDPCVHGWVFTVDKQYVAIKPTNTTVSLGDAEEVQIYFISIKRGAPMIKLEFCVSDDLESFDNRSRDFQSLPFYNE